MLYRLLIYCFNAKQFLNKQKKNIVHLFNKRPIKNTKNLQQLFFFATVTVFGYGKKISYFPIFTCAGYNHTLRFAHGQKYKKKH